MDHNLTLNFEKSFFAIRETTFLGHKISKDGISPLPEKIDIIKGFKRPMNPKQLKSFLGFINFYAKFAQNYADVLAPLFVLLKKGVKFKWEKIHQDAFERIKDAFKKDMVLAHPDRNRPYILYTDASDQAIGAALVQEIDKQEKVVTYISRTLKGPEKNYFTTEKELLAIVWALQRLRTYVIGAKIILRTDHQALSFLNKCRFSNSRITRWILAIQDYDLELQFIKGKHNNVKKYKRYGTAVIWCKNRQHFFRGAMKRPQSVSILIYCL